MTLTRIDHQSRPASNDPVWLICPVRNELPMLQDFLRHYRSLGIDAFCFIDNGSTDGTREYLLAQADCIVYYTDESYRESNFAADWINQVIAEMPITGWLVLADVDEHLVFSRVESRSIRALLSRYDKEDIDTFYGVMVDMYPSGEFMNLRIAPGDRMSQVMPYFDSDYIFRKWPRRPWENIASLQVLGGPRCRLLTTLDTERRRGWAFYTFVNQVDRFVGHVPQTMMPWIARLWPREVPAQVKMPINFVRPGFRFYNSHASTNTRFASEIVSLLHYKFCNELQSRFKMTSVEGNHFRRGLSYLQLQQALHDWGKPSLMYEGSRRFTGSPDLDAVGLTGSRAAAVWESGYTEEFRTAVPLLA